MVAFLTSMTIGRSCGRSRTAISLRLGYLAHCTATRVQHMLRCVGSVLAHIDDLRHRVNLVS
jgi:hypothetical protein